MAGWLPKKRKKYVMPPWEIRTTYFIYGMAVGAIVGALWFT
jgi:hypothetical protein